jgi:type II secretory pathway pseudopilin PulG
MVIGLRSNLKQALAFTMVELVVVLGIVAVLMGMGLFGVRQLQVAGRDNTRVSKLAEIQSAIDLYYRTSGKYPALNSTFQWTSDGGAQVGGKKITLTGHTIRSAGTTSDARQTYYIYKVFSSGYLICAKMERGAWYKLGPAKEACTA